MRAWKPVRFRAPWLALAICPLFVWSSTALADGVISGQVTNGAQPVRSAAVSAAGASGAAGALTDSSGNYSLSVPNGTYSVTANAPGFAVAAQPGVSVSGGGTTTQDVMLTSSGNKFAPLPVFGGGNAGVYAGGAPGVFYAQTSAIPQLFRTFDYGGTWQRVAVAADDATNGLSGASNIGLAKSATTSGVAGEVAAFVNPAIHFSTDFGNDWKAIGGSPSSWAGFPEVFWGHAAGHSVVLAIDPGNGDEYVADMSVASPSFTKMTTPYGDLGDVFAVGNGGDGPYVAAVSPPSSGSNLSPVNVCPLAATATGGSGCVAKTPADLGTDSDAFAVAFGGTPSGNSPPPGILTASPDAVAFSLDAGTTFDSTPATGAQTCTNPGGNFAEPTLAPNTNGSSGAGQIGFCFVTETGGAPVVHNFVSGVFDAGWNVPPGSSGGNDAVAITLGTRGPIKGASVDAQGVPQYPSSEQTVAGPGTSTSSAGASINGITAPVVGDTSFGPTGAADVATAIRGGVSVASTNGGATDTVAVYRGSESVDWWQGASGDWLVFGQFAGTGSNKGASAFLDWTPATPAADDPNLDGTLAADLGLGAEGGFVSALRGVPGTDTVFLGFKSGGNGEQPSSTGALRRGVLQSGALPGDNPSLTNVHSFDDVLSAKPILTLAYCPAAASAAGLQDALLVGQSDPAAGGDHGALRIVHDATTNSPTVTTVASIGNHRVNDVRADCASGTVYAGTGSTSGGSALYKSTNGAQTFSQVDLPDHLPPFGDIEKVGLNPSDPNEVLVAAGRDGWILRSTDAGADWAIVNDPTTGQNFLGNGVADLELPPSSSGLAPVTGGLLAPYSSGRLAASRVTASQALVSSGAGLYAANIRTPAPNTIIDSGPSGTSNDPTPTFAFHSSIVGPTSFKCSLDGGAFSPCASPKTVAHLNDGSHTFRVKATTKGATDPTPATRSFTVKTASVAVVSGKTLVVTAAPGAKDNLQITKPSASIVRVSDAPGGAYTGSGIHAGTGCTRSGDYTANCSAAGITLIRVSSGDQIDDVVNSTALKSSVNGGTGNDTLTGGSNNDTIIGGTQVDSMRGMAGNDALMAYDGFSDAKIDCGTGADSADMDLLPKDPASVVSGCETQHRH